MKFGAHFRPEFGAKVDPLVINCAPRLYETTILRKSEISQERAALAGIPGNVHGAKARCTECRFQAARERRLVRRAALAILLGRTFASDTKNVIFVEVIRHADPVLMHPC